MIRLFQDGGAFLWPLLACALAGLTIVLWKLVTLGSVSGATGGLDAITRVAPLIGFLVAIVGAVLASDAEGVKDALIPAAAGLAIAIPLSPARDWLRAKVDRFVMEMEDVTRDLLRALDAAGSRAGERHATPHVPPGGG